MSASMSTILKIDFLHIQQRIRGRLDMTRNDRNFDEELSENGSLLGKMFRQMIFNNILSKLLKIAR
jgi:hypothetical protein